VRWTDVSSHKPGLACPQVLTISVLGVGPHESAIALLEVEISLSELVLRYQFVREGFVGIEHDPEFQLTGILGRWTFM